MQDILRFLIGELLALLGHVLELRHRLRIARHRAVQARLRQRYAVEGTPVQEYGREVQRAIERWAEEHGVSTFAETSGSTAEPKRIAYPASRVREVKAVFIDAFSRAYAHIPIARKSLYVFSSITEDRTLTGMLVEERGLPPYLSGLQAPYRVQQHPEMIALARTYGSAALRLFVLALSNPGVLYATNPSTLAQFLGELKDRFDRTRSLIRDFVETPERFSETIHRIARRIESRGASARLRSIAKRDSPCSLLECAPAIEAYICWTGGYVSPFLERIERELPNLRRIPMYSMSTETIETIPDFRFGEVAFLPLAPGVLYEFIEEGLPDDPQHLTTELEPGKCYSLVVSDRYGLVRYQTGDLFRVKRIVAGLPDLHFERRRGLAYSFTGEKLTADQVTLAIERMRAEIAGLEGAFFSLVPACPEGKLPHYRLMAIGARSDRLEELAASFDRALGEINREYAGKRTSGRLGPVECVPISIAAFAEEVASSTPRKDWESQVKFLPLYPRRFER